MGGLGGAEGLTGYDEVDESTVFNGGYLPGASKGGMGGGGDGRKRGKKNLASRASYRTTSRRSMGGFFNLNIRGFEDSAKSMLAISIGALILCGVILLATFSMHILPSFYGSLAASIVVMLLLFFVTSRLIGASG